MKVGTDAVLLGAWTNVEGATQILDVGTGCGVVSLMLAQRALHAQVDAVDNDPASCFEATYNAAQSPWAARVAVHHSAIQSFSTSKAYDLIVSNPPYFSNSLRPPSAGRTQARHAITLTLIELLTACHRLLSAHGRVSLILPDDTVAEAVIAANVNQLQLQARCRVVMNPGQPAKRSLLQLGRLTRPVTSTDLVMLNAEGKRSDAYRELTTAYYLN